ncbi:BTAD domain-containing putative transcriptional regulator [Streptomyces cyslabdanicus]|uniref:BTAD domain-containing putative transcriptional regulator n=1 Tax=Streptomyces cyslabdanicus TaxID=1470456 RepID=UPI004044E1AF
MRFRVLGPIRMAPVTPSAAKPRAVLATLLTQANSIVSTHTLIDELWGTEPPRTATTTLQVYVSQLRKDLLSGAPDGKQPLLTRPPGYLLQVGQDDLDLLVFEALREHGRAAHARKEYAEASAVLSRALALWTGPALSGIAHGSALESSAIRLDELRTEVLEQRIGADLYLGRHQELIGELRSLVHDQPLRETLHCHLMVALYRSGRQSDALKVYRQARLALVSELGVEPGPVMSRLHKRILAGDPRLAWAGDEQRTTAVRPAAPQDTPTLLPPLIPDFTGRSAQLSVGRRFLDAAGTTAERILAVSGRPGVGKTVLVTRLAHEADEHFPDGRVFLRLRNASGKPLAPQDVVGALLQRLNDGAPTSDGTGHDALGDVPPENLLRKRTAGRKMLFVLDDAVSEAQMRSVLSALPDSTVVLTSRHPLSAIGEARHVVLDVFDAAEARAFLLRCGGARIQAGQDACAEIARLCGHLPLALRIAAAGLASRPHWTARDVVRRLADDRTRLSALTLGDLDVRSSLLAAYEEMGAPERHAFRLLGLAPQPTFAPWSAVALLGTNMPGAEQSVEELVRAQLLEARTAAGRSARTRYGFHPLLRSLSLELLGNGSPKATERLCQACTVLARTADALLTPGRDLRVHAVATPTGIDPAPLVGPAPLLWFQDEAKGILEIVRQAHAVELWQLCVSIASAATGFYEATARWEEWEQSHRLALEAARRSTDEHGEAVVVLALADLDWQRHCLRAAVDRYRNARRLFTRHGDRAGEARCLCGEADVALSLGLLDHAERRYSGALSAARTAADARATAHALRGLALTAQAQGRDAEARHYLADCSAAARETGDRRWQEHTVRLTEAGGALPDARHPAFAAGGHLEMRPGVWLVPADLRQDEEDGHDLAVGRR